MFTKKLTALICAALTVVSLTAVSCGKADLSSHIVDDGGVPEYVVSTAAEQAKKEFDRRKDVNANIESVDAGTAYRALDWRIENIALCHTYDDFDGLKLDVYIYNVKFLSDTPDKMLLAGGMYITDDGWYCPDYDNSRYLIFDGEKFLFDMYANDCSPGIPLFDNELGVKLQDAGLTKTDYRAVVREQELESYQKMLNEYQKEQIELKNRLAEAGDRRAALEEQIKALEQRIDALREQIAAAEK